VCRSWHPAAGNATPAQPEIDAPQRPPLWTFQVMTSCRGRPTLQPAIPRRVTRQDTSSTLQREAPMMLDPDRGACPGHERPSFGPGRVQILLPSWEAPCFLARLALSTPSSRSATLGTAMSCAAWFAPRIPRETAHEAAEAAKDRPAFSAALIEDLTGRGDPPRSRPNWRGAERNLIAFAAWRSQSPKYRRSYLGTGRETSRACLVSKIISYTLTCSSPCESILRRSERSSSGHFRPKYIPVNSRGWNP
jgi:hypothetical protein